jgi:hypothetical protein
MHHLLVRRIQSKVAMSPNAKVAVAKRDIIPAIAQFKDKRAAAASDLRHAQSLRLDRSPRRRSFTDDSDATRFVSLFVYSVCSEMLSVKF